MPFQPGQTKLPGFPTQGKLPMDNGSAPDAYLPIASGTFAANGSSVVTVSEPAVGPNSIILITLALGGNFQFPTPFVILKSPGFGFNIVAQNAGDTQTYQYVIIG